MKPIRSEKREQFIRDGYCLFANILEADLVARLRRCSDKILAQQEKEHFERQCTTGSMVLIDWEMAYQHDALAELIAHPRMLGALAELGFAEPRFGHGRVISKPPHTQLVRSLPARRRRPDRLP